MTCSPTRPCGPGPPGLGLVPPPPGETILRRRSGEFYGFLADLIATVEHLEVDGAPLGGRWDVEGDQYGTLLARLWASVAEGVAAQTELTAGEAYLATAQDWTDLRRLAALVGYRPQPRIAAQGWVVALLDRGVDPLVPAGTRVQAPGTPARAAQTYEAVSDTQLHAEWDGLTATWVPQAAIPDGRQMRFLGEPGFRVGDQLLFVDETPPDPPSPGPIGEWYGFWYLLTWWYSLTFAQSTTKALSVAGVTGHKEELGTSLVSFDRDLNTVLSSPTEPYGAYRILATASPAKRLEKVLRIPADTAAAVVPQAFTFSNDQAIDATNAKFVVLDTILEGCSAGQLVAVVDWATKSCDVVRVAAHRPVRWETAPGTNRRVSRLEFSDPVPALQNTANEKTIYVLDRRVVARHYVFPPIQPAGPAQLRLYPDPVDTPEHIAVGVGPTDQLVWHVFGCTRAATQEDPAVSGDVPTGLIVDLVDGAPPVDALQAPASGNLVRIHHGATAKATLGSGDATSVRQTMTTPDAPIASDVDAAGTPVPTMILRVDGVQWDEVASLYAAGPQPVFATRLEVDGAVTVEFGDGEQGARLPTGRNNVTAIYRVGGGTAGEVEAGAIDTLLGSVRGVKKVRGADPTSGGADQDDERRLRQLAPTRARAFGRAVSARGSGRPQPRLPGRVARGGLHRRRPARLRVRRRGAAPRVPAHRLRWPAGAARPRGRVARGVPRRPPRRDRRAVRVRRRGHRARRHQRARGGRRATRRQRRRRRRPRRAPGSRRPARAGAAPARPAAGPLRRLRGAARRDRRRRRRRAVRRRCDRRARAPRRAALGACGPARRRRRRRAAGMTDVLHPPVADWLPPAMRDAPTEDAGAPRLLDLLLEGVDRQRRLLEDDIDQVWQDLFIESCADWAVPYIASLVGLPPDAERLEVAFAIALRRRKGTPAALEDFAEVLTGLVARVIEGWQVTTWAQRLRHPPPPRVASVDLRDASRFRIGTPFDRVRRSVTPSGPYEPRAATVVVWPWEVRTYHAVQAAPLPEAARFALHPLGARGPALPQPRAALAALGRPADAHRRRARRAGARHLPARCRRWPRRARSPTRRTGPCRPTTRSRRSPSPAAPSCCRSTPTARRSRGPRCASAACRRAPPHPRPRPPARPSSTCRAAMSSWAATSPRRCARRGTARHRAASARWPPTATPIPPRA